MRLAAMTAHLERSQPSAAMLAGAYPTRSNSTTPSILSIMRLSSVS